MSLQNTVTAANILAQSNEGREKLSFSGKLAAALSEQLQSRCVCGRAKAVQHLLCPLCNRRRFPGPDVIVESADGLHHIRECGLENPVVMLARLQASQVTAP